MHIALLIPDLPIPVRVRLLYQNANISRFYIALSPFQKMMSDAYGNFSDFSKVDGPTIDAFMDNECGYQFTGFYVSTLIICNLDKVP